MDKIKKIFSPGSSKDDEVMYGNPSTGAEGTHSSAGVEGSHSSAEPVSDKKEHGVLRQILNPNGANYDEEAFGKPNPEGKTAAFSSEQDTTPLHTLPEAKKEHGVLRQILNPHGENYDELAYGKTAVADDPAQQDPTQLRTLPQAEKKEHNVLRQVLNPGGANYDEQAYGTTAVAGGATAAKEPAEISSAGRTAESTRPTETLPGARSAGADAHAPAAATTSSTTPAATISPTSSTQVPAQSTAPGISTGEGQSSETASSAFGSHFGRDAGLAGAGLASGGLVASQLERPDRSSSGAEGVGASTTDSTTPQGPWSKPNLQTSTPTQTNTLPTGTGSSSNYEDRFRPSEANPPTNPQINRAPDDVSQATFTARSYKLADAASSPVQGSAGAGGPDTTSSPGTSTGLSSTGPSSTGPSSTGPGTSTGLSSTGLSSTGPGTSTGLSSTGPGTSTGLSSTGPDTSTGLSSTGPGTSTGLSSTGAVGTSTGVSNTLESPHVPGEFPQESVEDSRAGHVNPATAAARTAATEPGAAAFSSPTGTTSRFADNQHAHDSDAAFAGAAGAFGIGAYGASQAHNDKPTAVPEQPTTKVTILGRNIESSGPTTGSTGPASTITGTQNPATSSSAQNYGHNVALAGESGGVHAAPYAPSQNYTSGHGSTTSAADPTHSQSSAGHHYGRDAALAGGAGAATAGAYEAHRGNEQSGSQIHDGKDAKAQEKEAQREAEAREKAYAKDVKAQEKAHEKEVKAQEKAHEKEVKAQEKAHEKDVKAQEKAYEKEIKAQEKEAKKEAKAHEKAAAQEAKEHDREEHHHGRDAAVAGGAATAGVGAYELGRDHSHTGPASKTIGPHESNVANVVDPRVQPDPERLTGSAAGGSNTHGHYHTLIAPQIDPNYHPEGTRVQQEQAHHGRDATLAGGAGVAGTTSQYEEAHHGRDAALAGSTSVSGTRAQQEHDHYGRDAALAGGAGVSGTSVQHDRAHHGHDSALAGGVGTSQHEQAQYGRDAALAGGAGVSGTGAQNEQTHYGRDAALAGGAGAATAGAYEHLRSGDETGPASKTIGPHESNVANVVDPRVQPDLENVNKSTSSAPHRSDTIRQADPRLDSAPPRTSHTGQVGSGDNTARAAEGGVAGAAGAGALESSGIGRRDTGPASNTLGPHESNVLNVLDPRVKPEPELMKEQDPITSGPHRSDIGNIVDPRVKSSQDRSSEFTSSEPHTGRDAALGAGAGVTGGTAAYEAEKHTSTHDRHTATHEDSSEDKPKHNKLHKPRPEDAVEKGEKQSFLSKILHPGRKSHSSEDPERNERSTAATTGATPATSSYDNDGTKIEPHTGLPIGVGKYGTSGAGGTDASPQIAGYHETDPATRNTDVGTDRV